MRNHSSARWTPWSPELKYCWLGAIEMEFTTSNCESRLNLGFLTSYYSSII
eukprot:gnl/Chilomastix_caulleri/7664.p1 GENE.gnl/Chilomastix_caulleri/7664~~gnl/Chilomastix_caulleri/7664.p1  ORF type:complete len:51 (-),score=2.36 gnl/Chilomastix_caulleri/7664:83-235(-)